MCVAYLPMVCVARERKLICYPLARALVFKKVRKVLGLENCRIMVSGAAPIMRETLEFFMSIDLPLMEGYGMSESSGIYRVVSLRVNTGRSCYTSPVGFNKRAGPPKPSLDRQLSDEAVCTERVLSLRACWYRVKRPSWWLTR